MALVVAAGIPLVAAAHASAYVQVETKPVKAPHGYKLSLVADSTSVSMELDKGKHTVQTHSYDFIARAPGPGRIRLHRTTLRGSARFEPTGRARLDPAQKGCANADTITPGVLHGTLVFKPDRHFFRTLRLHNLRGLRRAGNGEGACGDTGPDSETVLRSLSGNPTFAATARGGSTSAVLDYSVRPPRGDGGEANASFSHSMSADTGVSLTAAPDLSSAHFTAAAGALTGSFDFTRTNATCPGGMYFTDGPARGSVTARFDVVGPVTVPSSEMQLEGSNTCQAP